jgi:molybdate-binding protein
MYNGEYDVVSVYLYDGETEQYNLPCVKREKVQEQGSYLTNNSG